ncbi:hypothetical protein [Absidia glauca]|uniref:Uncharacterized protein n=1 Tax=Absidia glauca TaxID=4829 RepID=A0A168SJE6_ABSGL|nr:hypothetical protein [Absidia glauca]
MGLLGRFSSLSRKSRTKSSEQPPLRPMVDPLKQDHVTLNSNVSNDTTWAAPSTGSSLFDDIFMELGQSAQATEMSFAQLDLAPATYPTNECPPLADTTTHEPIKLSTTPTILDSDVSEDEDDEEDSDDSSDDENDTLGPILPRLDGAKPESMLDRMKDRHRQQQLKNTLHHNSTTTKDTCYPCANAIHDFFILVPAARLSQLGRHWQETTGPWFEIHEQRIGLGQALPPSILPPTTCPLPPTNDPTATVTFGMGTDPAVPASTST